MKLNKKILYIFQGGDKYIVIGTQHGEVKMFNLQTTNVRFLIFFLTFLIICFTHPIGFFHR